MSVKTEVLTVPGYEKVVYRHDPAAGLSAFIAIHNTALGPACGGVRLLPYASKEEALEDVLRLSKGMSYKSALAGIGFGGGKSVIIADPTKKTAAMFHAMGEFVQSLGGAYIAAKDMNISNEDLLQIKTRSPHVIGIEGVPGSSGDPSPVTARGLFRALEATVEHLTGGKSLKGLKIALQGLGHVGYTFAEMAREAGAELAVTDIDSNVVEKAVRHLGAKPVSPMKIHEEPCDIFSPCARGAILNVDSIPQLKCRAVVGAANNQLATPQDGQRLWERKIVYAPDFAVNSGGIINIFIEFENGTYDLKKALAKTDGIYDAMKEIFERSKRLGKAPYVVADELAEERMRAGTR